MGSVDRLLHEHLLAGEAARAFDESRARLRQRHGSWRANFPAFGALLDTDEERAQALAGNWATEAREIVGVWLSAQRSEGAAAVSDEERAAWVQALWSAWRDEVFARDDVAALEGAARERFARVFDDLMTRFRDDAVSYVRQGADDEAPSMGQRLAAPLRAVARAVEGFFFPSLRR